MLVYGLWKRNHYEDTGKIITVVHLPMAIERNDMEQDKFFKQSYSDALNDYVYSCKEGKGENWDWIVLTAANEKQAAAYELQIDRRRAGQWLPMGTKVAVVPDYKGERVGSGGATLNVVRYLCGQEGPQKFAGQRVLVIHSGGDSKRIPQYSACGKLFAPVPRLLPNGSVSTLFDELLILAAGIPNRTGRGMLIMPSDTEMLLNPLQLDLLSCDAAGLSMKAPVAEGIEHGVFLQGHESADHRNKNVARFLHKMPEAVLREAGAVDDTGQVDIDTGCIWLGERVVTALTELIYTEGTFDLLKFEEYVNPNVCLNFYTDFVYPLADDSSLGEYLEEAPENGSSSELAACRKAIWEKLHKYHLSLVKMVPAKYIHFGMTHELFGLYVNDIGNYSHLGWKRCINTNIETGTVLNSLVSAGTEISGRTFIEDSIVKEHVKIGAGTVLSNIEVAGCSIPDDIVLSGIMLKDGRFVCRIYGREDNPKASGNAPFAGGSIRRLIKAAGASKEEIWRGKPASIWNALIYPARDSMEDAVRSALSILRIMKGEAGREEVDDWKKADKYSLGTSFYEADVPAILKRHNEIGRQVKLEVFFHNLSSGEEMKRSLESLCCNCDAEEIEKNISAITARADAETFPNNMRLYLAASDICKTYRKGDPVRANRYEDKAYGAVKGCISEETFSRFRLDYRRASIKKDKVAVELPVRVNFCGSPSDAAPYCLEHGGTMIDGTLLLKGKKPVKVVTERIDEGMAFGSADQESYTHFKNIGDIQNCGDPSDPFALHKAAVMATGLFLGSDGLSMEEFCRAIGGGIRLTTDVDVPKGSGLGTSSIIAAAAVRAIHLLFGENPPDEAVYAQVFLAEQLMNTGGGWQDQVGGLTNGIKYFFTAPGRYQKINVEKLDLPKETMDRLNSRFALVFSGQRRLARNVLREEMNQCIRNDKAALAAVAEIQEYCSIMRHYLLKGEITEFAKYITRQFELVKKLDRGASNTCIEYIFDVIDDLIDGKSICGAGGGGFLQVILKDGVPKEHLKERIAEKFIDCGVQVWDCQLI